MRALSVGLALATVIGVVCFLVMRGRDFAELGARAPTLQEDGAERALEAPSHGSRVELAPDSVKLEPAGALDHHQPAESADAGGGTLESFDELEARFRNQKSAAHSAKTTAALREIAAGRFEFVADSSNASLEPRLHRPREDADSTFVRVATEGRTYLVRLERRDHPDVFVLVDRARALERELTDRSPPDRALIESSGGGGK